VTTARGYVPERRGGNPRHHRDQQRSERAFRRAEVASAIPPRKEDAACCEAKRLPDGRPVLGFCSPECIRRPGNWALLQRGEKIPRGGVPFRKSA
jgi:hypothetical protein